MSEIQLFQGDCLELMRGIPDGSVDCIVTDPPYGTTKAKWDLSTGEFHAGGVRVDGQK